MPSTSLRSVRIPTLLLAIIIAIVTSCGPSPELRRQMAELEDAAAQTDDLLIEVANLGRFIADINAELSDVSLAEAGLHVATESPIQASRESVLVKIRHLNNKVADTEKQLAQSRQRIQSLTLQSDTLELLLSQTITSYERTLENQRITIDALNQRVILLEELNVQLAASVDTLSTELHDLKIETNTVYYAIGTKEQLLDRGIVEKTGGARFLFIFGKRGETLVPARQLDPGVFTAVDKERMTTIELPDSTSEYEIASRHSLDHISAGAVENGKIQGSSIRIVSPHDFWKNSRFLIVVQKS
ncbi:MAG: hypothetical protein JSW51_08720 [Gemmatimonadota bacterium]|nr:MAG: hypothetical protein JSW51_08720 [Gemmatimonadota bacterium]